MARALRSGRRGRKFKSCLPDSSSEESGQQCRGFSLWYCYLARASLREGRKFCRKATSGKSCLPDSFFHSEREFSIGFLYLLVDIYTLRFKTKILTEYREIV